MSSGGDDPPVCPTRPVLVPPYRLQPAYLASLILLSATLFALSITARADVPPAPSVAALEGQLALNLPPYWKVAELTIEASANYGNAVEPLYKQRVLAIIEPTDDLYVTSQESGKIDFLIESMKASDTRKLYLIATSTLRAGAWQTKFEKQNDPTAGAGEPRSFFQGATMVRGSPEEQAYRKEQAAEAAAQQQRKLAAIAQQQALAAAEARGRTEKIQQAAALKATKAKVAEEEAARRHAAFEASLKAIETNASDLLKAELPPYWQVKTLTLTPPADLTAGAAIAPQAVVRQHFAATVILAEDTFIAANSGTPPLLQSALKAGAERELAGTVESVEGPEGWRSQLVLGNPFGTTDGQPRSYFPAAAIVKGSPDEAAFQKQQAAAAAAHRHQQLATIAQQQVVAAAEAKGKVEKVQQAAALQAARAKAAEERAARRHEAFEASLKRIGANANKLLRADVPAYWQIKALSLWAAADISEQADVAPQAVVRQRFAATIVLSEDTFAPEKVGAMTILHPVLKAGAERKLEGTVQSVQAPEGWRSTLAASSLPGATDGRPRAYYSARAILAGSPEEVAYRKKQAAILEAGAIPPGSYEPASGFVPYKCTATDMKLSDNRIKSFLSCSGNGGSRWNAAFVSGPVDGENPLFSRISKLGAPKDTIYGYTWGAFVTSPNSRICGYVFSAGNLIRTRLVHNHLLLLAPFTSSDHEVCEITFAYSNH